MSSVVSQVPVCDPNARPPNVLGVSWSVGNKLLVYPQTNPKVARAQDQNQNGGIGKAVRSCPGSAHFVTWETSLYGPVMRKLVNESAGAFISLQKLGAAGSENREF